MKSERRKIKKAALAYSGGLDTSIIVPWLKEHYGCEVVCYCSNVGQGGMELDGLEAKARKIGASEVIVEDLRLPFVRDFVFPMLRAGATYEGKYLLGTSIARPLIASRQVWAAERTGADALAHGCTGKGNDQVRFELTYMALAPQLPVIAPWREWDIVSREDALAYAARHDVPLAQKPGDLYSRDANLWHLSHEGGPLEDPAVPAVESMYKLTNGPEQQPAWPETVSIAFERGRPVALNGKPLGPVELVETLNQVAGRHGVGRVDMVENRYVGIKSRGVYETPGVTLLFHGHRAVEQLTLDREVMHLRDSLIPRYAEMVYYGYWFAPEREALQALVDDTQKNVNGIARLKMFKGGVWIAGRKSPNSLYDQKIASFEEAGGYNQADAEGFIRLAGVRLRAWARATAKG